MNTWPARQECNSWQTCWLSQIGPDGKIFGSRNRTQRRIFSCPAWPDIVFTLHLCFRSAEPLACIAWRLLSNLRGLRMRGSRDNEPQSREEPGWETTELLAASPLVFAASPLHSRSILVPRDRAPFGQHQESRPLARAKSNTGRPRFTDFPSLCPCSESSLTNLIGSGLNLLCLQSHSKTECRWTRPEVAILGAAKRSAASGDENGASCHSAHVQSRVWQIWLVLVSIYCVYKPFKNGIPHSRPQRSRSFWSAPRIATSGHVQSLDAASGDENGNAVGRARGADQKERGLWGRECSRSNWLKNRLNHQAIRTLPDLILWFSEETARGADSGIW